MGSSLASKGMADSRHIFEKGRSRVSYPCAGGASSSYLPSERIGLLAASVGISIFLQNWQPQRVLALFHPGPGNAVHFPGWGTDLGVFVALIFLIIACGI